MKAVVFGGSGFLGSHVADALTEAGHSVTIFDRVRSKHLQPSQDWIQGDILDAPTVRKAVQGQEVLYNFAGLADLDEAQMLPVETARTNVLGNTILLEEAQRAKLKRYVFASTIYVSGQSGGFYRASKQACELYVEEYQRRFGLDYTILRYGTVYGRRTNDRNSIYRYLRQALENRKIVVSGNGEELREYVHVTDVARCSVQILEEAFRNEPVVLTGHHPMRFRDLLEMIREIVGSDVQVDFQPVDPALEASGKSAHYTITPYTFKKPRLAKKLVSHHYVDLGEGLLDCLEEINGQLEPTPDSTQPQETAKPH